MLLRAAAPAFLIAIIVSSGCGLFGDEAAAGNSLRRFFDHARAGEIESALEWVAPENPTARLLARLRGENEELYASTLRDLKQELTSRLEGAQLHIGAVVVSGGRAAISGLILTCASEEREFDVRALKREGRWMLETLPEISLSPGSAVEETSP
jgi:hypothetical protein